MIKISVIVPVYNSEDYLDKCLDSICNQTLLEIEIIIIDDGSSDGSLKIIQRYAQHDVRIKYKTQKNQGPSEARNQGIAMAKGKYIAFVDSDDWIEKEMYETMYHIAEKYNLNMVMSNLIHDYEDKKSEIMEKRFQDNKLLEVQEIHSLIIPEMLKDTFHNTACNKIYKREFICEINSTMVIGLDYGEDLVFLLNVVDNLTKTYFINIPFYHYMHRKNNSLTNKKYVNFQAVLCYMYNIRKKYAKKWNVSLYKVAQPFIYYILMDLVNNAKNEKFTKKKQCVESYLKSNEIQEAMALIRFYEKNYNFKLNILFLLLKLRLISVICVIL